MLPTLLATLGRSQVLHFLKMGEYNNTSSTGLCILVVY